MAKFESPGRYHGSTGKAFSIQRHFHGRAPGERVKDLCDLIHPLDSVKTLEIEDDDDDGGRLLLQPCGALKGRRCGIYPHRPDCCRMFECRLLQEVKRGMVGVERAKEKIAQALKRIEGVKELVVQLGTGDEPLPLKEQCLETLALSEAAASGPAVKRKRAELQAAMTSVERLVQAKFHGG